jgi:hypothetical protein
MASDFEQYPDVNSDSDIKSYPDTESCSDTESGPDTESGLRVKMAHPNLNKYQDLFQQKFYHITLVCPVSPTRRRRRQLLKALEALKVALLTTYHPTVHSIFQIPIFGPSSFLATVLKSKPHVNAMQALQGRSYLLNSVLVVAGLDGLTTDLNKLLQFLTKLSRGVVGVQLLPVCYTKKRWRAISNLFSSW